MISGFLHHGSELSSHTLKLVAKAVTAHRELKFTCHQAIIIGLARVFYPHSASEDPFAL